MEAEEILNAYIDKHGAHPQKVQQLVTFTKKSKQLTNLKYSEARKIIAYSQSKSTKITTNHRLSIKRKKKIKNSQPPIRPSSPKNKAKSKSKSKSPPIQISKKNSNNKLIVISTTTLTPYIAVIDSSDDFKIDPISITTCTSTSKKKSKNKHKKKYKNNACNHIINGCKYDIGDHVKLTRDREGIIRYIGNVSFTSGVLFGIELLNGTFGKHDGKIDNKRYFTTAKRRGVFVKASKIQRKIRHQTSITPKNNQHKHQNKKKNNSHSNSHSNINNSNNSNNKTKWVAPYQASIHKEMEFKSERIHIHRQDLNHVMHNNTDKHCIDDDSMSIVYRKASLNLHRHILQKVHNNKKQQVLDRIKDNAFSAHSKLHSPMTPIRLTPFSPILTFENISTQTMKSITQKMMVKHKRRSLIMHKKPLAPSVPSNDHEITSTSSISTSTLPFSFSTQDEEKYDVVNSTAGIGFSPRDFFHCTSPNIRDSNMSVMSVMSPLTPAMTNTPPLSQVTIDYIEMEEKVNQLVNILINKTEKINTQEEINKIYNECDITPNDLEQELFGWVDLLCTHSKLFSKTLYIKPVTKDNCFFAPRDGDDINDNDNETDIDSDNDNEDDECVDKAKQALRKQNRRLLRNNNQYFASSELYYYTVFERLLFELNLFYLYFIYDIGFENSNAFNEKHPCSLFLLSGNITQILKKCSPVLNLDIDKFYSQILYPYHVKIRYKYLNNEKKHNIVSMIKYSKEDGIRNDYNFVARIQYEEMFDDYVNNNNKIDDVDEEEDNMDNDLEYELIVYKNTNRNGIVIYKSVIPSVFCITRDIKITNLKRTIMIPNLILKQGSGIKCFFQCEKWNEAGDYYGFIRIKIGNNLILNKESIISASECGYYKGNGFGCGSYKNDIINKTKYYSGGGYATTSDAPHNECPSGPIYGTDCVKNNCLYYGSPCYDDTERGGGIIDILCGNYLVNYGSIQCNGANGMQFGGSSGGSIKIVAKHFINYGNISADGGKGATYQRKRSQRKQIGTKGGDGRIFIFCNKFVNKGIISPKPTIIHIKSNEIHKYQFSHIKSLNQVNTF